MGITAFPFSAVLDVSANTLLGNNTGTAAAASALSASQVRSLCSLYSSTEVDTLLSGKSNVGHTHSQSDVTGLTASLATKADLVGGLVPASQLPSYVDDVIEAANLAAFPATGEAGKIYVALDTGRTYRWGGSSYVELTDSTAVWGSISGTLANQTDLQTALNGKSDVGHTHAWNTITSTPTTLTGYGITDGITATAVAAGYQPLDADLTAIAALTGTGIYYRSAADTWSLVAIGSGLTFSGGTLSASGGGGSGISSLNGLTDATQTFQTGTSGTNIGWISAAGVHTLNMPDASATARGLVTTGTQRFAGMKYFETGLRLGTGANDYAFTYFSNQLYIDNNSGAKTTLRQNAAGIGVTINNARLEAGTLGLSAGISVDSDVNLERDAANILNQRRGTNPQTQRITNTHTSTTSYEWLSIGWSSNVCTIGTEKGSAGGTARPLHFGIDGAFCGGIASGSYAGIGAASNYAGTRAAWVGHGCNVSYYGAAFGWTTQATTSFASAIGAFCTSDLPGRTALCPGQGSPNSVHADFRRSGTQSLSCYTTDATPRALSRPTTGSIAEEAGSVLNTNRSIAIQGIVLALLADNTETACWFIKALFQNNNGTVTMIFNNVEQQSNNSNAWSVSLAANNTTKTWEIIATGQAGKAIRWDGIFLCSELLH